MKRQCELLKVNRTSVYYKPIKPSNEEYEREEYIKARLDYWHTKMPYLGVRRLVRKLRGEDNITIGRKLVKRYMAEIGIYCIFPKPNLSKRNQQQVDTIFKDSTEIKHKVTEIKNSSSPIFIK